MSTREEINDLKAAVASWFKQRDELSARYRGVRPSHVVDCD
jgi:hypothetical protein